MKNGLVEEENYKKKTLYSLTKRGLSIFKTLAITKRVKKLQTTIKMIDDALQALPAFSENNEETPKRKQGNENY